MRSQVDRIYGRAVSRDVAKPQTTEEKPRFPAGLGDARMRFELERYFTIDIKAHGFDDSDADDVPTEDVEHIADFEFADPESLKIRPGNLSSDEAYRWDSWEFAQRCLQTCGQRVPSPAEIDYCTFLARLDRVNSKQLRQDNIEGCKPGLLDQFAPTMTNSPGRPPRRGARTFANSEVRAR